MPNSTNQTQDIPIDHVKREYWVAYPDGRRERIVIESSQRLIHLDALLLRDSTAP